MLELGGYGRWWKEEGRVVSVGAQFVRNDGSVRRRLGGPDSIVPGVPRHGAARRETLEASGRLETDSTTGACLVGRPIVVLEADGAASWRGARLVATFACLPMFRSHWPAVSAAVRGRAAS